MPFVDNPMAITTKDSPRPFDETVTRLVDLVAARGMKVFLVIDQVKYLSPDAFASRYQLDPDVAGNLTGIDPLTDALVAP